SEGIREILIMPETSRAANYAFDVTPSRLVTGLITERGICAASAEGVFSLYPEKRRGPARGGSAGQQLPPPVHS
ncbi:MAG: hypothetical protein ACKO9F_18980, partial [Caldilinea sp.]